MLQAVHLPRHWQKPLLGVLLATLACIAIFWESWRSIAAIWSRSDTFAHGYLVAPISSWLIWTRRNQYKNLQPKASPLGLFAMACCGFAWMSADLTHVLVVQQWAVVGVLICAFWTILGNQVTSAMLFPILFLFLMVPFGEDFIPFLMEYTATFTVWMLRLTGISVYREGLHFTLTSGSWSVVDACSGIRYLIASITLGLVYAYLNYTSYLKRAYFIFAAILTPILANGMRAYMIVMIGHLSNMKLATGVDHLIYGWLFFGLVMLLLFYVGSFWQDPAQAPTVAIDTDSSATVNVYPHFWSLMSGLLLCLAIWPISSTGVTSHQSGHVEIPKHLTQPPVDQWQPIGTPNWNWEPQFQGVAAYAKSYLSNGETVAGIYVANFDNDSQGGELINSQNVLVAQKQKTWRIIRTAKAPITWLGSETVNVDESVLNSNQRDLLVLRWYRIGSDNTANTYYAKWLQLLKRLTGDNSPELLIVLYTETPHGEYRQARELLQRLAEACCG